ncbi:hypothetical protein D8X75_13595 [Vibrio cholerae]|nr:hypothetical protein [Vibrio cholerae]EGR1428683.1 hypothetical protein [Vibrio cholerae]EGR2529762.1 hypothetical protein [Vibrio cholerae]MCD1231631.1 hypothetical protein [Vibrio cholerae]MCD1238931.1 hypothetical protein [Vibrio cholerae]
MVCGVLFMYKISDFWDELVRKTQSFFSNHLFFLFFVVFILVIGTFGIWVKPVIIDQNKTFESFYNSFNALNLIGFSVPLLVVLSFDKVVSLINNRNMDVDSTIWFVVLYIITIVAICLLFALGFSLDKFTWCAFFGWLLAMYLWILGNVDNPAYQKRTEGNAASGGSNVDRSVLEE